MCVLTFVHPEPAGKPTAGAIPLQIRQERDQHQGESVVHHHWTSSVGLDVLELVSPVPAIPASGTERSVALV